MALLPAWVPTEALLIALVAAIVLVIAWNRGNRWIVNLLATDEPVLAAIGVFLVLAANWLAGWPVLEVVPPMLYMAAGALAFAIAVVARYTELIDIEGLV